MTQGGEPSLRPLPLKSPTALGTVHGTGNRVHTQLGILLGEPRCGKEEGLILTPDPMFPRSPVFKFDKSRQRQSMQRESDPCFHRHLQPETFDVIQNFPDVGIAPPSGCESIPDRWCSPTVGSPNRCGGGVPEGAAIPPIGILAIRKESRPSCSPSTGTPETWLGPSLRAILHVESRFAASISHGPETFCTPPVQVCMPCPFHPSSRIDLRLESMVLTGIRGCTSHSRRALCDILSRGCWPCDWFGSHT